MSEAARILEFDTFVSIPEKAVTTFGMSGTRVRRGSSVTKGHYAGRSAKQTAYPQTRAASVTAGLSARDTVADDYTRFDRRTAAREGVIKEKAAANRSVQVRQPGKVSATVVITFLFAAALMFMMVYSHVELSELTNEMGAIKKSIASLKEEEKQLVSEYENLVNLKAVEERAREIGMVRPSSEQITYIDATLDDKAEVVKKSNESVFLTRISNLFNAIVEYIE